VVHEPEPDESVRGLIELPMAGMGAPTPTIVQTPVFTQVAEFSNLSENRVTPVFAGDKEVILVRLGAEVNAFDCNCPGCKMSLSDAKLSGNVLVCTWQNCAYDARNGRRVDGVEGASLRIYPVSVQGNRVLLATDLQARELFSR
jgi:nitrite reductase/ring-hydroxylating ferredoxin subunit